MNNAQILNIAHRGARSLAPENTLLAAQKGWDIGADWWELDVAMTADGEMVVIHDDTLKRTSNAVSVFPDRAPWGVHTFSLTELRRLDFGSWFIENDPFGQIAAGNVSSSELHSFQNVPIPTLREALEFTRDHQWKVNVEIKDLTGKPGNAEIVEKATTLITKLQLETSVLISSFNHSYLERVKRAIPEIATAALVEQPDPNPVELLNRLNAKAYNPGIKSCIHEQFIALRKARKDIFVWTVNDEATMRRLIEMGATGLFTDFPQLLKSVLDSR